MNRFERVAEAGDDGKTLLSFLRGRFPLAADHELRASLKSRDIRVNEIKTGENILLRAGDRVVWYTKWTAPELPVAFEDENIFVINKPAGICSDRQEDGAFSVEEWGRERGAEIVHRLDQQTSGLLMLAKNQKVKEALEEALRLHQIEKTYHCVVVGVPPRNHAVLHAYLYKDALLAKVSVSMKPGPFAKEIVTEYDVVEVRGDCSLLRVTLHTGRTHQIRAHLAFIGFPLLGDDKYGSRERNRLHRARRLMLCSTGLKFLTEGELSYLKGRSVEIPCPF